MSMKKMRTGVLGGACVAAVLWMNAAGVASQQPPDGDLVTAVTTIGRS